MLHIKLKRMWQRTPYKRIFYSDTHPLPLGWDQKVKSIFTENSHVAYQIKREWSIEYHAAHIMPLYTSSAPWVESKGQKSFFLNVFMLHINLKGIELRARCKPISCPYTNPQSVGRVIKGKNYSECGHAAYQIKGKEVYTNIEAKTLT